MKHKTDHESVSITYESFPFNRPWHLVYEDGSRVMRDEGTPKQFSACFRSMEQALNFIKRSFRGWGRVCNDPFTGNGSSNVGSLATLPTDRGEVEGSQSGRCSPVLCRDCEY